MGRDNSIRQIVAAHAEASTRDDGKAFHFTPTQAALAWWGLHLLRTQVAQFEGFCHHNEDYADELRCRADAIDWASNAMTELATHAENHNVQVTP